MRNPASIVHDALSVRLRLTALPFDDDYRMRVMADVVPGYTLLESIDEPSVFAYCERCEEFVARFDSEDIRDHSPEDMHEAIVNEHRETLK